CLFPAHPLHRSAHTGTRDPACDPFPARAFDSVRKPRSAAAAYAAPGSGFPRAEARACPTRRLLLRAESAAEPRAAEAGIQGHEPRGASPVERPAGAGETPHAHVAAR